MNLDALEAFIRNYHADDCVLYLLLDPLAGCATDDPLHLDRLRERLGTQALTPILRPDFAHAPLSCAHLIRLAGPGETPSQALLQCSAQRCWQDQPGFRRYVCGWLSSPNTADALGDHLIKLGQLADTLPGTFCPVYEPLRLHLLAGSYGCNDPAPWGPIRSWLYPASSGEPRVLNARPVEGVVINGRARSSLADAALVARVLRLWSHRCSVLPCSADQDVLREFQLARQLKLENPLDLVTFALHQLTVHDQLHRHPRVRECIANASQGKYSLAVAFDSLNEADWNEVLWNRVNGVAQ